MWPLFYSSDDQEPTPDIHESEILSQLLGVGKVYIRYEGNTPSGSMKDYLARKAIELALQNGFQYITVTSSGNHALAIALHAQQNGLQAIIFIPADTSKLDSLCSTSNTDIIGINGTILEDVYELAQQLPLTELGIYNANVNNELLLTSFGFVARSIAALPCQPTHILSGVGNGTYLAGIAHGLSAHNLPCKIVPVGMTGAFPTEIAFASNQSIYELDEFGAPIETIDAAEGSIAISSYSMPQLIHAIKITNGFTLGGLNNNDLAKAYQALLQDQSLIDLRIIPEPTGIMSLAAAIKHSHRFPPDACLLLCLTGNGLRAIEEIQRLTDHHTAKLLAQIPQLTTSKIQRRERQQPIIVDKDISLTELTELVHSLTGEKQ